MDGGIRIKKDNAVFEEQKLFNDVDLRKGNNRFMKVLFMGTPEFALGCLKAIIENEYEVCGVVTQPDKPKGRGHKMVPTPVKAMALENGIPVFQPLTLKNEAFAVELKALDPDIIVVVAYGQILPKYILDYPRYGCINVHASLLPKYRGAGPIQWCVINGEKETGVTTMYMAEGLDTGDMLIKESTDISENETAGELHDRLSEIGARVIIKTIEGLKNGTVERTPQDDSLSSYAPMISKETGKINWNDDDEKIFNLVRGTNPWPISHTLYKGEPLKVIRAEYGRELKADIPPGKIVGIYDKKLEVMTGNNRTLLICELQFAGSKRMSVESYLNGHTIDVNEILG